MTNHILQESSPFLKSPANGTPYQASRIKTQACAPQKVTLMLACRGSEAPCFETALLFAFASFESFSKARPRPVRASTLSTVTRFPGCTHVSYLQERTSFSSSPVRCSRYLIFFSREKILSVDWVEQSTFTLQMWRGVWGWDVLLWVLPMLTRRIDWRLD